MRVEFVSVLEQDNLLKTHLNIFLKENRWTWKSLKESVYFTNAILDMSNSPNFRVCGWNPMV